MNTSSPMVAAEVSERPAYAYDTLEEAFPEVESYMEAPFGHRVLVQIRTPMTRTKGGIVVPHETRETEQWNTQVAKVIALGEAAFKNRDTLESWPEGAWAKPGDFVRCPKYGGDRWEVPLPNSPDSAIFVVFDDTDLVGPIAEKDVLKFVAYLK